MSESYSQQNVTPGAALLIVDRAFTQLSPNLATDLGHDLCDKIHGMCLVRSSTLARVSHFRSQTRQNIEIV